MADAGNRDGAAHRDGVGNQHGTRRCAFCPAKFSRKALLEAHQRIHFGQVRRSNDVGRGTKEGATFMAARRPAPRPATRVGGLPKRYSCDACEKRFSCPSHLERHARTHRKVKAFCAEVSDGSSSAAGAAVDTAEEKQGCGDGVKPQPTENRASRTQHSWVVDSVRARRQLRDEVEYLVRASPATLPLDRYHLHLFSLMAHGVLCTHDFLGLGVAHPSSIVARVRPSRGFMGAGRRAYGQRRQTNQTI